MNKVLIILVAFFLSSNVFALQSKVKGVKNSFFTNKHILNGFGCEGENVFPTIKWSDLPVDTKSIAVTIHDPDAPTGGGGWWHWVVTNIPVNFKKITPRNLADMKEAGAIESLTSFGAPGYGGACPPAGDNPHRYIITVYALKGNLEITENTMPNMVGFFINQLTIAKSSSTVLYGR